MHNCIGEMQPARSSKLDSWVSCVKNGCNLRTLVVGYTQMVVYMQQHQQGREGAVEQADLSAFIRNTVTIHSLITDRVDRLRPSQQLTLKVCILCLAGTHNMNINFKHNTYTSLHYSLSICGLTSSISLLRFTRHHDVLGRAVTRKLANGLMRCLEGWYYFSGTCSADKLNTKAVMERPL